MGIGVWNWGMELGSWGMNVGWGPRGASGGVPPTTRSTTHEAHLEPQLRLVPPPVIPQQQAAPRPEGIVELLRDGGEGRWVDGGEGVHAEDDVGA